MQTPSHLQLHSHAEVETERAARYAKQLASHLGRKITFTEAGGGVEARLGTSRLRITPGEHALILEVEAGSERELAQGEHVLGDHLERFGTKDELHVQWQRS